MEEASMLIARLRRVLIVATVIGIHMVVGGPAYAQSNSFAISAGAFNFDLSGTGTSPLIAMSVDTRPAGNVLLEGGLTFAFPEQQFDRTTFIIPEAQLQYQFPIGRFAPFVGGGVGAAIDIRDEFLGGTDVDLALSIGGGVRANLSDSFGLRGDFRMRAFGGNFSSSAAELRGGAFWRF
jgi:hypothetical protein